MRQDDIVSLLPRVFQRSLAPNEPLDALLAVMEGLQAPTERLAADVESLARPWQAPEAMLPYLARWLDVDGVLAVGADGDYQLPGGAAQLRRLLEAAAEIAQWRGTERGLLLFLTAATGVDGFAIDETVRGPDGEMLPFVIGVVVPQEAAHLRPLIERVVTLAKPAYVQCLISDAPPPHTPPPPQPGAPDA